MQIAEAAVRHWFPGAARSAPARLEGGDVNDLYRVDIDGRGYVLRVAEPLTTAAMVRWEHALVSRVAPLVPEVLAPLRTPEGATFVEVDGRIASMAAFVEGRRGDRLSASDRDAAARTLGRLHAALGEAGPVDERDGYPALGGDGLAGAAAVELGPRGSRVSLAAHCDLGWVRTRTLEELPAAVARASTTCRRCRSTATTTRTTCWSRAGGWWRSSIGTGAGWTGGPGRRATRCGRSVGTRRGRWSTLTLAARFLEQYERAGGEVLRGGAGGVRVADAGGAAA